MRITSAESDKWHGKSLHEAIVELLRRERIFGANSFARQWAALYGGRSTYHTDKCFAGRRICRLGGNVIRIDRENRDDFAATRFEMIGGGL